MGEAEIAELFGIGTKLANGQRAANGYQALSELDSNGDAAVNASDADFSKLMVWVDANGDGVSAKDELHSLESLGIRQLNLNAQASGEIDNGNHVGLVSSYVSADGSTREMADVWFRTSNTGPGVAPAAAAEANQAAAPVTTQVAALAATQAPVPGESAPANASARPAVLTDSQSLSTAVAGLADAMAAFSNNTAAMVVTPTGIAQ